MTNSARTRLARRSFGGWHVYDRETGALLGWVVRLDKNWHAYVDHQGYLKGREVGWGFPNRREAVAEVWIQREDRGA